MKDVNKKREREKRTVSELISLYCRKNHHTKKVRCVMNAGSCRNMRLFEVINVPLWQKRLFAATSCRSFLQLRFTLLRHTVLQEAQQSWKNWFKGTGLYKKHLESFVEKKGMKISTKIGILTCVTLLMAFGFFMMARKGIWVPCIILAVVWVAHIVYFVFFIKTVQEETK